MRNRKMMNVMQFNKSVSKSYSPIELSYIKQPCYDNIIQSKL